MGRAGHPAGESHEHGDCVVGACRLNPDRETEEKERQNHVPHHKMPAGWGKHEKQRRAARGHGFQVPGARPETPVDEQHRSNSQNDAGEGADLWAVETPGSLCREDGKQRRRDQRHQVKREVRLPKQAEQRRGYIRFAASRVALTPVENRVVSEQDVTRHEAENRLIPIRNQVILLEQDQAYEQTYQDRKHRDGRPRRIRPTITRDRNRSSGRLRAGIPRGCCRSWT